MRHELVTRNSLRELQGIVEGLNGQDPRLTAEGHAALIRYVEAWNKTDRNPWKTMTMISRADAERFSFPKLEKVWRLHLAPIGWPQNPEMLRTLRDFESEAQRKGQQLRMPLGGAYWWISPTGDNFRDIAAFYVSMLLANPMRAKLSDEPCQRERCKRWFIKRRTLQKCCSRRCTVIVKAGITTSVERAEKHTQDIKLAQKTIREWKPSVGDWKEFVSKRTKRTVKWVSRNTANKEHPHRELRPPSRRARSKTSARNKGGK